MKTITLNSLVLKNFRSYQDETVYFSHTIGLKLLGGDNHIETRLGSNGSGKSSCWSGVCWVAYGTGIRGEKISSLLSWGEDKAEGILNLTIDGIANVIQRTGPPNKVTINGEAATQEQVDNLIGLPKHRFLNSVIFGQGIPLFPDLTTPERGQLLDEVLNLDLWNKCSETATKKYTSLEKSKYDVLLQLSSIEGKISGLETEQEINYKLAIWNESRTNAIGDLKQKRSDWKENIIRSAEDKERELTQLETEINETVDILSDQTTGDEDQIEETEKILSGYYTRYSEIQGEYHHAKVTIENLSTAEGFWINDKCPACSQPITKEQKETSLATINISKKEAIQEKDRTEKLSLLIDDQIQELKKLLDKYKRGSIEKQTKQIAAEREYNKLGDRIKQLKKEGERLVSELEKDSDPYSAQIVQLQHQENPYTKALNENKLRRRQLTADLTKYQEELKKAESSLVAVEFWKTGFKRIRLYFIQQILTSLEIEIKSAISALGLEGWSIKLSTEQETKSGSVRLGISLQVTSPTATSSWESWSGGEAQRLRLAVALGLGSLIQRASGTSFSFEIFDEPTNFLSTEGIEDLLEALNYRAQSQRKQIWIVDHRALTYSGFSEIWSAVKGIKGTKIIKLSEAA